MVEIVIIENKPHKAGPQWKFAGAFYFATLVLAMIGKYFLYKILKFKKILTFVKRIILKEKLFIQKIITIFIQKINSIDTYVQFSARLRTFHSGDQIRKSILYGIRDGGNPVGTGNVPKHRREIK